MVRDPLPADFWADAEAPTVTSSRAAPPFTASDSMFATPFYTEYGIGGSLEQQGLCAESPEEPGVHVDIHGSSSPQETQSSTGPEGFESSHRPHKCPVETCPRAYRRRGDLKIHCDRVHADVPGLAQAIARNKSTKEGKPFHCPFRSCVCGFMRKGDLVRHLKNRHRISKRRLNSHFLIVPEEVVEDQAEDYEPEISDESFVEGVEFTPSDSD